MTHDEMTQLECLIDKHSLSTVVQAIAEICWEKVEHARSTWQDEQTAKCWTRLGNRLNELVGWTMCQEKLLWDI